MRKLLYAFGCALCVSCFAATPAPAIPTDVGVAATGSSRLDIFAVGSDNAVWTRTYSSAYGWGRWMSLGGVAASPPAAVSWQNGRADVFQLGTDGHAYQAYRVNEHWSEWIDLGGGLTASIQPAVYNDNRLDIFSRDTNNQPIHRTWLAGSGWSPWYGLGGQITTGLTGLWWTGFPGESPRLDVFARGTTDGVLQNVLLPPSYSAWTGWYNLGGGITSGVSPASPGPGRLDVGVRGTDNAVYYKTWLNTSGWSEWYSLGGRMSSGPKFTWWKTPNGSDRLDVWARDDVDSLVQKYWTPAGWSGWNWFAPPSYSQISPFLGIAQDSQPSIYPVFIDQFFQRLGDATRRFRVLANYDAAVDPDGAELARVRALVNGARAQGAEVLVTLRNHPGRTSPSPDQYQTGAAALVSTLGANVTYWGTWNEPNWSGTPGNLPQNGTTASDMGQLASYYGRLANLVGANRVVGPEFMDGNTQALRDQVGWYRDAAKDYPGGGFGVAAALHPYGSITNRTRTWLDSYANSLPANVPLWFPEAGSRMGANGTDESQQDQQVSWLVGLAGSSVGSGGHPINRIYYYALKDPTDPPQFDTGLLRPGTGSMRRASWWTFCAAAHGTC